MKRWQKYLAAGLALMFGLGVIAILMRDSLVRYALMHWTSLSPLTIQTLRIDEIGLHHVGIERLVFARRDQSHDLSVDLERVNLQFGSWLQLPNSIEQLNIADVFVQLDTKPNAVESDSSGKSLPPLSELMALLVPIETEIKRFEIVLSRDFRELLFEAIGSLKKDSDTLNVDARFGVMESFLGKSAVQITRDGHYRFSATGLDSEKKIIALEGSMVTNENMLALKGFSELQLEGMQILLQELGLLGSVKIENDRTRMEYDIQFSNEASRFAESLRGQMLFQSQLGLPDIPVGKTDLHLHLRCTLDSLYRQHCELPQELQVTISDPAAFKLGDYFALVENEPILFRVNSGHDLRLDLNWQDAQFEIQDGRLKVAVSTSSKRLVADVELDKLDFGFSKGKMQLHSQVRLTTRHERLNTPTVTMRNVKLQSSGVIDFSHEAWQANIEMGTQLQVDEIVQDGLLVKDVKMKLSEPVTWKGDLQDWYVSPFTLSLAASQVRQDDFQIDPAEGRVMFHQVIHNPEYLTLEAVFDWPKISLRRHQLEAVLEATQGNMTWREDNFHFKGGTQIGSHQDSVAFEGHMATASGEGVVLVQSERFTLVNQRMINQMVAATGYPLVWNDGTARFLARANWNKQSSSPKIQLDLTINNGAGVYAQAPFNGLQLDLSLQGQESWNLSRPARIRLEKFFVGVPFSNLQWDIADLAWGADMKTHMLFDRFAVETLGGSIVASDGRYDEGDSNNEIVFLLSDLSLEQLIAFQQAGDLYASGHLNGVLPVKFQNGHAIIENGWLRADERGGIIRYSNIEKIMAGTKGMELVSDLLKNFHYTELSADASLKPGGELKLKTHLQGNNPDADQPAVNLNFNIELNLLKALKTARLLYNIDRDLETYLRSKSQH